MTAIYLYTDGSMFMKEQRVGAWAYLFEHAETTYRNTQAVLDTTNNRMELQAAIEGLKHLDKLSLHNYKIIVQSDSQYVIKGASEYILRWQKSGWRLVDGKAVRNQDQWLEMIDLMKRFSIHWEWVRGHAGHPMNEAVDKAARRCAKLLIRSSPRAGAS